MRILRRNSLLEIDPKAQRISTEGNSRIRDSFLKMQREAQANDTTIDWGERRQLEDALRS